MKFLKYSLIALIVTSFASCLKAKNDFGGLREDEGSIVVSIAEKQYSNVDLQNLGFHWLTYTNFDFTSRPDEEVKFFTIHVSQTRDKKLSGPITIKFTTAEFKVPTSYPDVDSFHDATPLPTGAIVGPLQVTIQPSSASSFDVPVKFKVNKSLLDVNEHYGVAFIITEVTGGDGVVFSEIDKRIDVLINQVDLFGLYGGSYDNINESEITGRYATKTSVVDSAGVFTAVNNTRPVVLYESVPGEAYMADLYISALWSSTAFYIYANNKTTGANTALVPVTYVFDATGKVIDVKNTLTGVSLNPVFDASSPNRFVYTSNDVRTLDVKYTIRLTASGLNRPFTITESYKYDMIQAGIEL